MEMLLVEVGYTALWCCIPGRWYRWEWDTPLYGVVSRAGGIYGDGIHRLCGDVSQSGGIGEVGIQKFENDLSLYSEKYVKEINLKIVKYPISREQQKRDTNFPISLYLNLQN